MAAKKNPQVQFRVTPDVLSRLEAEASAADFTSASSFARSIVERYLDGKLTTATDGTRSRLIFDGLAQLTTSLHAISLKVDKFERNALDASESVEQSVTRLSVAVADVLQHAAAVHEIIGAGSSVEESEQSAAIPDDQRVAPSDPTHVFGVREGDAFAARLYEFLPPAERQEVLKLVRQFKAQGSEDFWREKNFDAFLEKIIPDVNRRTKIIHLIRDEYERVNDSESDRSGASENNRAPAAHGMGA